MKKAKIFFITLIITALLLMFLWTASFSYLLIFLIIFFLVYISAFWVLDYDIDWLGLLTLLFFPSLIIGSVSIMLLVYTPKIISSLPISNLLEIHLLTIIVFFVTILLTAYSSIISMNIFNVSRYKRLPLLQAAQTIIYTYTVIGGYLMFTLVHHFFLSQIYIFVLLYLLICLYLFFINTWSIKLVGREMISLTLLGVLISSQLILILLFFPLAPYVFTIAVTACIYIYNGIVTHLNKRNLLQRISLEYGSITLILILLILFTSHWGIAGNIIGQ